MKIFTEKQYMHIVKTAGRTCQDYYNLKAELDNVKRERELARVMAEGQEKETFRYKSLYEREKRRNERLKNQNGKLYQRVVALSVGGEKK